MVTTNFTLRGEHVMVLAWLDENKKPVYSLEIDNEVIVDGIPYDKLLKLAEAINGELYSISTAWDKAGSQLAEFHRVWTEMEVKASVEQESGNESGPEA